MRPVRIEVEGFSAYRRRVQVDFTDVDFFSLAGPTGSGKSSLIDAMIFALYGRVPRLGGNAVAPAITAGADRARVRFDFTIGDDLYTAVRLAQRTSAGGATVKEARLQRGDTVIADGADDVTSAVEDLLRLRFDDFTRTVVLPQGEFARFLTATKSERQGLLRGLLGLDVYTQVRELARTRAAVAGDRASSARRSLEAVDLPDEQIRSVTVAHWKRLEALAGTMAGRERDLSTLDERVAAARAETERLDDAMTRLASIAPPADLDELESLTGAARAETIDAEEALSEARERLVSLEEERALLPDPGRIQGWARGRARLAEAEQRIDDSGLEEAKAALGRASAELEAAKVELEEVRIAAAASRTEHAAHDLAGRLRPGEPCLVCAQVVATLPVRDEPDGLSEALASESRAEAAVDKARARVDKARGEVTAIEARVSELETTRSQLRSELVDAPEAEALDHLEKEHFRLSSAVGRLREEVAAGDRAVQLARTAWEDLANRSRRAAKRLTEAQLQVADLSPPVPESDDVVVQWKEMLTWRDVTVETLEARAAEATAMLGNAVTAASETRKSLIAVLQDHGVTATESFSAAVTLAQHDARARVEAHEKAVEEARRLEQVAERAAVEAAVAEALVGFLRANGFEQWLMAGALGDLVGGANHLLGQLSGGGHSLHSDAAGSFAIVDHRNADEMRSVATLSGGETFLVSLALALSLAETLAAKGGAELDAIILDEGFGTLDEESLDTVATVLEELTGRGLMVGIITHVKELAARAPTRYEVVPTSAGAEVVTAS